MKLSLLRCFYYYFTTILLGSTSSHRRRNFTESQHWFKSRFNNYCVSASIIILGESQPALNITDSTVVLHKVDQILKCLM